MKIVRYGSYTAFGAGIAGIAAASFPLAVGGIAIAGAGFLANRALVSQAEPLQS